MSQDSEGTPLRAFPARSWMLLAPARTARVYVVLGLPPAVWAANPVTVYELAVLTTSPTPANELSVVVVTPSPRLKSSRLTFCTGSEKLMVALATAVLVSLIGSHTPVGAVTSKATVLSALVEARLLLPRGSWALSAGMLAVTVPVPV